MKKSREKVEKNTLRREKSQDRHLKGKKKVGKVEIIEHKICMALSGLYTEVMFIGTNHAVQISRELQVMLDDKPLKQSEYFTNLGLVIDNRSVNQSRDMSRDHFAKNWNLLTNWWPV